MRLSESRKNELARFTKQLAQAHLKECPNAKLMELDFLRTVEKALLEHLLETNQGVQKEAQRHLSMSRVTLHARLGYYRIDPSRYQPKQKQQ